MKNQITRIMRTAFALAVITVAAFFNSSCDTQQATSATDASAPLKGTYVGGFVHNSATAKFNSAIYVWTAMTGKIKVFDSGIKELAGLNIDVDKLVAVGNLAAVAKGRTISIHKYESGQISQIGASSTLPGQYNINTLFLDGRKIIASLEHAGASWWVDIDTRAQASLFGSTETYTFATSNEILYGFGTIFPHDGGPATGGIVRKWDSRNGYNHVGDINLSSGGIGDIEVFNSGIFGLLDPFQFYSIDLVKPTEKRLLASGSFIEACSNGTDYALSSARTINTPKQEHKVRGLFTRGMHNIDAGDESFIAVTDSGFVYKLKYR